MRYLKIGFWYLSSGVVGTFLGAIVGSAIFIQLIGPPAEYYEPGDGMGLLFCSELGAVVGFVAGLITVLIHLSRHNR